MISKAEALSGDSRAYSSYDELPNALVAQVMSGNGRDGVSLLRYGKEWAYEFMELHQPRTAEILLNASDFTLLHQDSWAGPLLHVIQEVEGQIVEVCRQTFASNPDDNGPDRLRYKWERSLSLPEDIRFAYYHRIDGLNIPRSVGFGPFTRMLPYPISRPWESIDDYLGNLRLKKKLLPMVEEMIPGIKPDEKDMAYTNFMMFLNSWGSFTANKRTDGDHLFVKNHISDGVIYYIRDADVANMMILAEPTIAIDSYCEHVLLRKEGRFDFRPWAVPFENHAT